MVNETDEKRYPFLMTGQKIYIIKQQKQYSLRQDPRKKPFS